MMGLVQHESALRLAWVVRLRWGAVVAQLFTFGTAQVMGIPGDLWPILLVVGFGVLSNVAIGRWLPGGRDVPDATILAVLALDVVLLTVLLVFTGGPLNPFTFLYLVHVALAAIVLPPAFAWALTALCAFSYFGLFVAEDFTPPHDHRHMALHLKGMWVAFAIAAVFISFFVSRVRTAMAQREREAAAFRELQVRSQQLSALATLAGGAAHELSTPLSTISVAASEVMERLQKSASPPELVADMKLVLDQVERCRAVLMQLSADGGAVLGEAPRVVTVGALLDDATREVSTAIVRHDDAESDGARVDVPPRAVAVALRGIIKNAVDAGGAESVSLRTSANGHEVNIVVEDRGPGIPSDVLARIGEPFFTTKAPGRGMGLGVFLARTLAERLGGALDIESSTLGTKVSVRLPLAERR